MPHITIFCNGEKTGEHKLQEDRQVRVGRSRDSDIVIADSAVSSVHAEIECDGGFFYITDFSSRNGTFVNRELVISRRLGHGDIISIGAHNLKFIYTEHEKKPLPPENDDQGATMHIDTPHHRGRLARSVADLAERHKQKNVVGMISPLKKDGKPVYLDKPVVTIGKDAGSDIVVKGWFVPGRAAEIKKKNNGYYLNPVSRKPPVVNSQPIHSEVVLNEFDIIRIGSTSMQFQYHKYHTAGSTKIL